MAVTRAEKAVWLTFSATRMRNGKHESNYPSRFIREIDSRYILNPLGSDDGDAAVRDSGHGGSSFAGGPVSRGFRTPAPAPRSSGVTPFRKPAAAVPEERCAGFEPSPVMQLAVGQRVEHNRFGFGVIREISGNASDRRARILFDDFGEKNLMLNYAKIRIVDIV